MKKRGKSEFISWEELFRDDWLTGGSVVNGVSRRNVGYRREYGSELEYILSC